MFLKNYTSDVPVVETIRSIEKILIQCGVSGITKEYTGTDGQIGALTFSIETPSGPLLIRLPVDIDRAHQALWMDYVGNDKLMEDGTALRWGSRKRKVRSDFLKQAERTAWRIIYDWVGVQMSMIQMKQADTMQVFLPYIYDNDRKQSYYQFLQDRGFKGLLTEST